jgi:hypothetical protein
MVFILVFPAIKLSCQESSKYCVILSKGDFNVFCFFVSISLWFAATLNAMRLPLDLSMQRNNGVSEVCTIGAVASAALNLPAGHYHACKIELKG